LPAELALLALLLAGYALVAGRLARLSIGPAMAFVAIGFLVSEEILGPISLEPGTEPVRLMAEGALTLLLFVDASGVRARALRQDSGVVLRLLAVGLLLTIVLGTLGAAVLFPGVTLGLALLIGSALAPTDAALGQPVVTNAVVPARIRRLLNVESGLNDGIATPFVLLGVALATAEATGHEGWLLYAASASLIGVAVGVGLGLAGGRLLSVLTRAGWTSSSSRSLFVLGLAASCYLTSLALGGNGFIAAFVGGLAFGIGAGSEHTGAVHFTEIQGTLLSIGVWTAFGLILAGELATTLLDPAAIAFAILSLTVFRMVPVALALLGTGYRGGTVLFMGWFGPRGLASIVFLIIGLEALSETGLDAGPLSAAVAWTVLLSVMLHGLSAGPLAKRYGRLSQELPPGSPELADDIEPTPARPALPHLARQ
jgi:NhaP-type Na+/H+ or K+/H+ antiporter